MTTNNRSSKSRDEAFRRLGRNIANFQLLERTLKQLIPALGFSGTISELTKIYSKNGKRLRKKSLGNLTEEFKATLFSRVQSVEVDETQTEPSIHFSFKLDASPDFVKEFKARWQSLVRERNLLVHDGLQNFDLSNDKDCDLLSQDLDEQNTRIHRAILDLRQLDEHRVRAIQELVSAINTEIPDSGFSGKRDDA